LQALFANRGAFSAVVNPLTAFSDHSKATRGTTSNAAQSETHKVTRLTGPVVARREPRFDADCARFQPKRPVAWRFEGGSHAARTSAGSAKGCKNRDVGVGWNSACCP
jgi:hypothetical protein